MIDRECCFLSSQVDLLAKLPEVPRFQLAAMSLTGPGKAAMSVSMLRWGELLMSYCSWQVVCALSAHALLCAGAFGRKS